MIELRFKQWLCEQDDKCLGESPWSFTSTESIYIPPGGKKIPRDKMPQIASTDVPEFLRWLEGKGVKSSKEKVRVDSLKPSQGEINIDKVRSLIGKKEADKPSIVSDDDYILDGHHRWLAFLQEDPTTLMDCYRIQTGIDNLIRLGRDFPKSFKRDID